jgi:hypothetical protein
MLLVGEGGLADRAVGEDVEIELSAATQVTVTAEEAGSDDRSRTIRLTVRNARPVPVRFEARIALPAGSQLRGASARLDRKDGRPVWVAQLLPESSKTVTYMIVNPH